ncbi:outer membrane beta-barrel family protein [Flavihumibacter petaseus]|uniref:Putative TonB-dependent receptor n=1 Tax=Flavihumibacter petaseus NBRC 106054 TaxID=1220578 RepID=A0A0E9MX34_9BACT|nr:outer membrane beta-barrel family protein [Flavihumibacter petaseus]GAO42063.1 putative TonB-dependent receptor [Flavihumibacter petaseus NBRC 106054]
MWLGLSVFCQISFSQAKIAGKVQAPDLSPLQDANVLLLKAADSSLVKGTTTNRDGQFAFSDIGPGEYRVLFSGIGFADKYAESFTLQASDLDLGLIPMTSAATQMAGVTVSARKPLFEQKLDRMVVNVKSSITNVGATVLDVLERSPGVIVNRSAGTIAMAGRDGVLVTINGKMTYMPADALIQYLQGLNAANVEKLELIPIPPAQYDASGNAGMINIVLINNPDEGFNGNAAASMAVGPMEGTQPMASINMNFRKGPLNVYGSYSFSRLAQLQEGHILRTIEKPDGEHTVETITDRDPFQRNHDYRLGLDYAINRRTVVGFLVAGYNHKWDMEAQNYSYLKVNNKIDTTISIANQEINYWRNWMANANISHTVKDGESISFNIDYLQYKDSNPTEYQQQYTDGEGKYLFDQNMNSGKETVINIWATQLDYTRKINEKFSLQMGAKATISRFSNDVLVEKEENGQWVPDMDYTADYSLRENIAAAYVSADFTLSPKTSGKAGLRYEHTTSNLGSDQKANIVDRKYGNLFPSVFISQVVGSNNRLNISYSKRITRPTFNNLAPFLIFFDPKTFISGNPALQPAISHNFKLDLLLKKLVFSVGYSYEKATIGDFQNEFDTANNVQTIVAQNLDKSNLFQFMATLPIEVTPWWTSNINLGVYYQEVSAHLKNGQVKEDQWYYTISGAETFRLPKKFTLELSGYYQSKSLFGVAVFNGLGALNIAVQRKICKDQVSLTAGVDDLFSSGNKWVFYSEFPQEKVSSHTSIQVSYRMYKVGVSVRFGNKLLKDKRERATASEDERKRVQ